VNGSSSNSTSGVSAPISVAAPRPAEPNQEKNVTPTKIEPKSDKADLHQLLLIDSSLKAAARADRQGGVLETAGEMDAETACAVALMASHEVSEAAAEIGLGRPAAWHVSLGNSTWYIVHCREELVVTFGSVTKNPASTLSKVAKSCGV
ncbi:MAG TPA: hypothetical protein VFQ61_20095, partial [Polyangiaceae bacterium]|nr:hypothetical protein [Polyangiaceae bacterium]